MSFMCLKALTLISCRIHQGNNSSILHFTLFPLFKLISCFFPSQCCVTFLAVLIVELKFGHIILPLDQINDSSLLSSYLINILERVEQFQFSQQMQLHYFSFLSFSPLCLTPAINTSQFCTPKPSDQITVTDALVFVDLVSNQLLVILYNKQVLKQASLMMLFVILSIVSPSTIATNVIHKVAQVNFNCERVLIEFVVIINSLCIFLCDGNNLILYQLSFFIQTLDIFIAVYVCDSVNFLHNYLLFTL